MGIDRIIRGIIKANALSEDNLSELWADCYDSRMAACDDFGYVVPLL